MKFDLILHDGKIMNGVDEFPQNFDIGIKNDKIISVGDLKNESSTKKINCKNLIVLPGVIDTQVHFREPGLTKKGEIKTTPNQSFKTDILMPIDMWEHSFTDYIPAKDAKKKYITGMMRTINWEVINQRLS